MENNYLLIGVDGGATKVSGWAIARNTRENVFNLGTIHSERAYSEIPGYIANFKPVELTVQLSERDEGRIHPSNDEKQQSAVYIEACAQVIEEISEKYHKKSILVGLGMPGLKTESKRGIAVVANGPRMIHYCAQLEKRLAIKGIRFLSAIHHIGSDADYCGIGENFSVDGLFRDINNGYYLGGGTGVADALKLKGSLLPFDQTKEWMAKSWELKCDDGRSFERFASAGGIQSIYADFAKTEISVLNERKIFPYQMAELVLQKDEAAIKTFNLVVENLALLLYERISTLYSGWQASFSFVNPNRADLKPDHPYLGMVFDRIIIGQRLGDVFDSDAGSKVLKSPVIESLNDHIQNSKALDTKAKAHYADLNKILSASRLREAPVIGAGIDAYLTFQRGSHQNA